jgi:tetratricopeptide (TPR) repeat protein
LTYREEREAFTLGDSERARLDSWKEIAAYLNTSVRTVQRWENEEELPVHRHGHSRQDTVYAFKNEIDQWRANRDRRHTRHEASLAAEVMHLQAELGSSALPPRTASWRIHQGPILARHEETTKLRENLGAVLAGGVRMVCLTGEPGAGKTTVIDQFLIELEAKPDLLIAFSACSQRLAGVEAFLPILDALEQLTRAGENSAITRLLLLTAPTWYVQVAPLWSTTDAAFASVMERARAASPERLKRELFNFVAQLTAVKPLVIAIDDLHWADASTIEALAYLLTRPELKRVLIVCAYRQTEMALSAHPFVAIRHELVKRRTCLEVPLGLWDREATAGYLELAFPDNRFPDELAHLIQQRTGGNPLFLCEMSRALVESGAVRQRQGQWVVEDSLDQIRPSLPASVQSIIQRKVDQIEEVDRALLAAASVQGVEFDADLAARVAGLGLADAEERLRRIESVHSFVMRISDANTQEPPPPSERYAFMHVLYQEALNNSLPPSRKAEFSLAAAEGLAERNKENLSKVAVELAIFYEAGRDFQQAAHWFLQGARNAAKVYANHEAADLSKRAMENAARLADAQRTPLELQCAMLRAEVHLNTSAFEDAVRDFGLAEKAAAQAGLIEPRIDAICGAALALFNLKRTGETRALGLEALGLAHRSGLDTAIASAEMVLAMERMCRGDLDGAQELSVPALPVLQNRMKAAVPLHVIEGVGYGAALHGWRLEYEQALPPCEWALEKARERGSGFHIVCLLFIRGLGMGNFGRLSDSLADLREGMRLSEINHERYWLPRLPNTLGWLHSEMFDLEEALRLNQEGSTIAREMNFPEGDANSQINLAFNYLSLGEPERSREHLSTAAALLNEDEWFRWVYTIRLHAGYAQYWLAKGDTREAAKSATASLDLATVTRRRKHVAWARKLLGDVAALEDRLREAVGLYEAGLFELKGHPCPSIEWKIMSALAGTHARLNRADESNTWKAAARVTLDRLADTIREDTLRTRFRNSEWVRNLRTPA